MDIISALNEEGGISMEKKDMQNISKAGLIVQELNEIKKMQKSADSYWTMWSNTCLDFLTILCC